MSLLYGDVSVMTVHLISSVVSSVKNKDVVQPLHQFCLIRAYFVHCSDSASNWSLHFDYLTGSLKDRLSHDMIH